MPVCQCPSPDAVVCVRLEPLHRADAALVGQRVVVGAAARLELVHDQRHALLHLLLVRVAGLLNVRLGDTMGAEKDFDGIGIPGVCRS